MAQFSVRKLPSGNWQYRFEAAKVDGKRRQISKGGFSTKAECTAAAIKAVSEYVNAGTVFVPSEVSFSDFLDKWVEAYCKVNLKPSSVTCYEKKIKNHIKPALGIYRLCSISTTVLQDFINAKFNDGYSMNSLTTMKGILNLSLDYAVKMKYIASNPMHSVRLPNPRATTEVPTRKKVKSLYTEEQIEAIFKRFPKWHPCHLPFMLAYRCGLRVGEVFGLMVEDIDLDNKTLSVNRQIQWNETDRVWRFSNPKFDSFRTIGLDDEMCELLRDMLPWLNNSKAYYQELYTRLFIDSKNTLISVAPGQTVPDDVVREVHMLNKRDNGTYIQPRVMQHAFRVIHYDLNMPDLDFHSLRHTHATFLFEQGVPMPAIQKRLGHSNIDTTVQVYTNHSTELMEQQLLDVLNKKKDQEKKQ